MSIGNGEDFNKWLRKSRFYDVIPHRAGVCIYDIIGEYVADCLQRYERELIGTHSDDLAVQRFADAMKEKMAEKRTKGYGGWEYKLQCPTSRLQRMLVENVAKGDPVDVGNFSMMLFNRGDSTSELSHVDYSEYFVTKTKVTCSFTFEMPDKDDNFTLHY